MHSHYPPIERLQLHLEDQHTICFNADDDQEQVLERAENVITNLTGWFAACATYPELLATVTYPNLTKYLVWDKKTRAYTIRKRGFALGRVYFAGPNSGERFYLRLLLHHVPCPKSWNDLKQGCSTFKGACVLMGLLADDVEWDQCLAEAAVFLLG